MINLLRLLYFIPVWGVYTVAWLVISILGVVLIPLAVVCRAYEYQMSPVTNTLLLQFKWKFMFPYSNLEDGILHGYFAQDVGKNVQRWFPLTLSENVKRDLQIVYWSLIRNPVNNVRFTKLMGLKVNPDKIRYIGSDNVIQTGTDDSKVMWFLCWHGVRAGVRFHFPVGKTMVRVMFGYKVRPADSLGVTNVIRKQAVGFAYQFRRSKRG